MISFISIFLTSILSVFLTPSKEPELKFQKISSNHTCFSSNIKSKKIMTYKEMIAIGTDTVRRRHVEEYNNKLNSLDTSNKEEWFKSWKELLDEYSDWIEKPKTIYDEFNENDIILMERCIETETFECAFREKVNVASVILNRYKDNYFPNQIDEIIVPGQFAFGRRIISEDTKLALEYAYIFGDTTNKALFFHSNEKTEKFCGADYIFSDKVHHFYTIN